MAETIPVPDVDPDLQKLYEQGRDAGFFKGDEELTNLAIQGVKNGWLIDRSGGTQYATAPTATETPAHFPPTGMSKGHPVEPANAEGPPSLFTDPIGFFTNAVGGAVRSGTAPVPTPGPPPGYKPPHGMVMQPLSDEALAARNAPGALNEANDPIGNVYDTAGVALNAAGKTISPIARSVVNPVQGGTAAAMTGKPVLPEALDAFLHDTGSQKIHTAVPGLPDWYDPVAEAMTNPLNLALAPRNLPVNKLSDIAQFIERSNALTEAQAAGADDATLNGLRTKIAQTSTGKALAAARPSIADTTFGSAKQEIGDAIDQAAARGRLAGRPSAGATSATTFQRQQQITRLLAAGHPEGIDALQKTTVYQDANGNFNPFGREGDTPVRIGDLGDDVPEADKLSAVRAAIVKLSQPRITTSVPVSREMTGNLEPTSVSQKSIMARMGVASGNAIPEPTPSAIRPLEGEAPVVPGEVAGVEPSQAPTVPHVYTPAVVPPITPASTPEQKGNANASAVLSLGGNAAPTPTAQPGVAPPISNPTPPPPAPPTQTPPAATNNAAPAPVSTGLNIPTNDSGTTATPTTAHTADLLHRFSKELPAFNAGSQAPEDMSVLGHMTPDEVKMAGELATRAGLAVKLPDGSYARAEPLARPTDAAANRGFSVVPTHTFQPDYANGWDETVSQPGRFASDASTIIDKSSISGDKSRAILNQAQAANVGSARLPLTQGKAGEIFNNVVTNGNIVPLADKGTIVHGGTAEKTTTRAAVALVDQQGRPHYVDADRFALVQHTTGATSFGAQPGTASPIVAYKAGKPVAVMMPVDHKLYEGVLGHHEGSRPLGASNGTTTTTAPTGDRGTTEPVGQANGGTSANVPAKGVQGTGSKEPATAAPKGDGGQSSGSNVPVSGSGTNVRGGRGENPSGLPVSPERGTDAGARSDGGSTEASVALTDYLKANEDRDIYRGKNGRLSFNEEGATAPPIHLKDFDYIFDKDYDPHSFPLRPGVKTRDEVVSFLTAEFKKNKPGQSEAEKASTPEKQPPTLAPVTTSAAIDPSVDLNPASMPDIQTEAEVQAEVEEKADPLPPKRTAAVKKAKAETKTDMTTADGAATGVIAELGDDSFPTGPNYTITDDDAITVSTAPDSRKREALVNAIVTLKRIESQSRMATPEEQKILARFPGWGWTGNLLNAANRGNHDYTRIVSALTQDELSAAIKATQNSHYTAPDVIRAMWHAMAGMGFKGGYVLEPSAGSGLFFGLMPEGLSAESKLHGVELDSLTGRILRQIYQGAKINIAGFETLTGPNNLYDVAIGNVPFGNIAVSDIKLEQRSKTSAYTRRIHNYFFVRSLERVRPGGVIAFITSNGTLDASDPVAQQVRKYLNTNARLLGAVRLPNNAFAANAGTEVVTDIIFLQKRFAGEEPSPNEPQFQEVAPINGPDGKPLLYEDERPVTTNEYFAANPGRVLGHHSTGGTMYRGDSYTVEPEKGGADLLVRLTDVLDRLPSNGYVDRSEARKRQQTSVAAQKDAERLRISSPNKVRALSLTVVEAKGKDGVVAKRAFINEGSDNEPSLVEFATTPDQLSVVEKFIAIRDDLEKVIQAQLTEASTAAKSAARENLKKSYNAFATAHGTLHDPKNRKIFLEDPAAYGVLALEDYDAVDRKVTGLAPIFDRDVINPNAKATKVTTVADALAASLRDRGSMDINHMATLLDQSPEDITTDLLDQGLAFSTPDGRLEEKSIYGSGNVRAKLRAAEAEKDTEKFAPNVAFLQTVQPTPLRPSQIRVGIGARWVPIDTYVDFMHQLGYRAHTKSVQYAPATGGWMVNTKNMMNSSTLATVTYGTDDREAGDIFERMMNGGSLLIYRKDSEGRLYVDNEASTAVKQKSEAIEAKWNEWIMGDPGRATTLTDIYNETVNVYRLRTYDGSHLTFPGLSGAPFGFDSKTGKPRQLRPHQRNAAWRMVQDPFVLLAHDVGTGKTATMAAGIMELRRLGLRNKPMLLVLKATIGGIASEFKRLYPNAKLLVADAENFTAAKRKEFAGKVATGDWDCVLLWHDAFKELSPSPELINAFYKKRIDELNAFIVKEQLSDRNAFTAKEAGKKVSQLETQLKNTLAEIGSHQDNATYWESLGVDQLVIDEAQEFKNLYVDSVYKDLKINGNQKTMDLLLKMEYLRGMNGGITFSTGTPVTNSPGEIHTLLRYLAPQLLAEQGLTHADDWAHQYVKMENVFEQDVALRYRQRDRMVKIFNVPELVQLYRTVADTVNAEDIPGLVRPRLTDANGKFTDKPIIVTSQPDEYQKAFYRQMRARAESPEARKNPNILLKISTDGRLVTLDARLRVADAPFDPHGKAANVLANVLKEYHDPQQNADKRTQLIFLDQGVPNDKGGFSVYADMTQRLVAAGVPRKEIAWIYDADTDVQKEALFRKVRSGEVRILIGSRKKMGIGVNVQDRLVAIHQVDPTWRPDMLEQAQGRIVRQGNLFTDKGVREYQYVTVNSFDGFMWNKVATKAGFINQVTRSKNDGSVRDAEIDDEGSFSYDEILSVALGDPRIQRWLTLKNEIKNLDNLRRVFQGERVDVSNKIKRIEQTQVPALREKQKGAEATVKIIDANPTPGKFAAMLDGRNYEDRTQFGDALLPIIRANEDVAKKMPAPKFGYAEASRTVGEYRGLKIVLTSDVRGTNIILRSPRYVTYDQSKGSERSSYLSIWDEPSMAGLSQRLDTMARNLLTDPERYEADIKQAESELPALRVELNKEWPDQARMDKLQEEFRDLDKDVAKLIADANKADGISEGSTAGPGQASENKSSNSSSPKPATPKKAGPLSAKPTVEPTTAEGWMGSALAEKGRFLSDLNILVDTDAMDPQLKASLIPPLLASEEHGPHTQAQAESLWNKNVPKATIPTRLMGFDSSPIRLKVFTDKTMKSVAFFETDEGNLIGFNGAKIALVNKLTTPDSYMSSGDPARLVAMKDGKPVALVMPLNQDLVETYASKNNLYDLITPSSYADDADSELLPSPNRTVAGRSSSPSEEEDETDTENGVAGAPRRAPSGARIAIAPITGGNPKALGKIEADMQTAFGRSVQVGRPEVRGAGGSYNPANTKTVIRYEGDLDTMAHDLWHHMDDTYNLVGKWKAPRQKSPYDGELIPNFSEHGSSAKTLAGKRREAVAEWGRAYMVNPDATEAASPQFTAYVKKTVPAEQLKAIDAVGTQMRQFAGLPGAQKMMLNRQWANDLGEPTTLAQKIDQLRAKIPTLRDLQDRMEEALLDDKAPLIRVIEEARRLTGVDSSKLLPMNDVVMGIRLLAGTSHRVMQMLETGIVVVRNGKEVKLTKGGFAEIFKPLQKTDIDFGVAYKLLGALLDAERVAYDKSAANNGRITGTGKGLTPDLQDAQDTLAEFAADPNYPHFREAADLFREWTNATLQYQADGGYQSQEWVDKTQANNPNYVSFHRVDDPDNDFNTKITPNLASGLVIGRSKKLINRFKGSAKKMDDPYRIAVQQTFRTVQEVDRNQVVQQIEDQLMTPRKMYQGAPIELAPLGSPAKEGDPNTIKVIRVVQDKNGDEKQKTTFLQFPNPVYKAVMSLTESDSPNTVMKMLMTSRNIIKNMLLVSTAFALRHYVRSNEDRQIKTDNHSTLWDSLIPINAKEFEDYRLSGGVVMGDMIISKPGYDSFLAKLMHQLNPKRDILPKALSTALHGFHGGHDFLTQQAPQAEYRAAYNIATRKLGYDHLNATRYASYAARNLVDGAVGGYLIKQLNLICPFLNYKVQGTRATIRAFKKAPARTTFRLFMLGLRVVGPMAWNAMMHKTEVINQLPAWRRDSTFNFYVGPNQILTVPKGFPDEAVTASLVERAAKQMMGDKNAWEGYFMDPDKPTWLGTLPSGFLPIDEGILSDGIGPLAELAANYDFRTGSHIIPDEEEGLPLKDRVGASQGSRIGKALSMGITDPRKWDHIIAAETGGIGATALNLSDWGRNDKHVFPAQWINGLLGAEAMSPAGNAPVVREIQRESVAAGLTRSPLSDYDDGEGGKSSLYASVRGAKTDQQRETAAQALRDAARSPGVRQTIDVAQTKKDELDRVTPKVYGEDPRTAALRTTLSKLSTNDAKHTEKFANLVTEQKAQQLTKPAAVDVPVMQDALQKAQIQLQIADLRTQQAMKTALSQTPNMGRDEQQSLEKRFKADFLNSLKSQTVPELRAMLRDLQAHPDRQ